MEIHTGDLNTTNPKTKKMGKLILILSCIGVTILVTWETFPNQFDKLYSWFRSFKKLKSVADAQYLNLTWEFNAYGDQINLFGMRSGWVDKYGIHYQCDELFIAPPIRDENARLDDKIPELDWDNKVLHDKHGMEMIDQSKLIKYDSEGKEIPPVLDYVDPNHITIFNDYGICKVTQTPCEEESHFFGTCYRCRNCKRRML